VQHLPDPTAAYLDLPTMPICKSEYGAYVRKGWRSRKKSKHVNRRKTVL
jgi:hypothetical protein